MRRAVIGLGLFLGLALPALAEIEYPKSRQVDVVDDYHGTKVRDPYRWLEDLDSREVRKWVEAQNRLSLPFLARLPQRDAVEERLKALWSHERYGVPQEAGGRLFFTRADGLQNQPVLYVQEGREHAPRALLDPNSLAADGSVALTQFEPSPDGRFVAYALSSSGSDWREIRIREVSSGEDTGEVLSHIKFTTISWTRDGKGFFYSRYPAPAREAGPGVFAELQNHKLYYHKVGSAQDDDRLIFERPDQPRWLLNGEVTDDGRFLMISIWEGTANQNRLYYKFLGNDGRKPDLDGPMAALVDDFEASFVPIGNEVAVLYLLTDLDAPRKRIIAVDLRAPDRKNWLPVVPQSSEVIDTALLAGRELIAVYMRDASHRIRRFSMDGQPSGELRLPGPGAVTQSQGVTQITGSAGSNHLYYSYTSFNRPPTNYRCDLRNGRCNALHAPQLPFDPEDFVTEQVFYQSKDGTRVPMFITRHKATKKSPDTRALLYGYGGFEIALLPSFSVARLVWMEQGGIFVQANLRGGSEYGRAWHQAGIKERKQNVFDDFIAAAEHLIKEGWTSADRLAIEGRSNGGLLVGAVLNQRPELFAAALPAVGVMDMLRFHKFTIGWAWTSDYGSSEDPVGFRVLHAYSPYHNVRPGTRYPAVLITTADHDDRVVPSHSYKYAAALQAAQRGDRPILIRIDTKAGHGAGKATAQEIQEAADKLAFALHYTRPVQPPAKP